MVDLRQSLEGYYYGSSLEALESCRTKASSTVDKDWLAAIVELTFNRTTREPPQRSKLSEPSRRSQLCTMALYNALPNLFDAARIDVDTCQEFVARFPNLMNAMARWVFTPQHPDHLLPIERDLGPCTCLKQRWDAADKELVKGLHTNMLEAGVHFFQSPHLLAPIAGDVFAFLAKVIRLLDPKRLSKLSDRKKSKSTERGLKELGFYLEKEPDRLFLASVEWFLRYNAESVLAFLEAFSQALPTVFQAALLKQPQFPTYIVGHLSIVMDLLEKHQKIPDAVCTFIQRVSDFLGFVTSYNCLDFDSQMELFETKAGEALYIVLAHCVEVIDRMPATETSWLTQCTSTLQDLAAAADHVFLWAVKLNPRDEQSIFWTDVLNKWFEKTSASDTPCLNSCHGIQRFRNSRRCMNGDCRKTPDDAFKPFSRCAGCGLLSYCSRECQRKGWTQQGFDSRYSHRLLCKDLGRLRPIWPQTDQFQYELMPEMRLYLYAGNDLSTEEIIEKMGEDALEEAIDASKAFPNRGSTYLNPETPQGVREEMLEGLLLEKATAVDPSYYTPEKMKQIAERVADFEEFVEMNFGHFALSD